MVDPSFIMADPSLSFPLDEGRVFEVSD